MSKYKYSEEEQQYNNVLSHQASKLEGIAQPDLSTAESCIKESEELLENLGYSLNSENPNTKTSLFRQKEIVVPSWDMLYAEAELSVSSNCDLEDLFTADELEENALAIQMLNDEYNAVHKLDKYDISISAISGIASAAVDLLLVGIPQRTSSGLSAAPLSDYIRKHFDSVFPADEMERLANSRVSKVPYDAQDNRNTTVFVDGLSAYYHRLLSLGHDPLLGFIVGTADILFGTMTTIDKAGRVAIQVVEGYANRKEEDVFSALIKQVIHFKTDVTTAMGLPAPLMGLFNLLQFGSIGEEEQTIAEIVQGMYYEGFDFVHFLSQSIPVMLTELVIRLGYAIKRIKEGYSIKESIPFSLDRSKHPKLSTMLFIGHSAATAINAGKVYFTKNPMEINYPQWLAFAKYSYSQLKWVLLEKPEASDKYVMGIINGDTAAVLDDIERTFSAVADGHIILFEN